MNRFYTKAVLFIAILLCLSGCASTTVPRETESVAQSPRRGQRSAAQPNPARKRRAEIRKMTPSRPDVGLVIGRTMLYIPENFPGSHGRPILPKPVANVPILFENDTCVYTIMSDAYGFYVIELPAGTYKVDWISDVESGEISSERLNKQRSYRGWAKKITVENGKTYEGELLVGFRDRTIMTPSHPERGLVMGRTLLAGPNRFGHLFPPQPAANMPIGIKRDDDIFETISDAYGFYIIELPAGKYEICLIFNRKSAAHLERSDSENDHKHSLFRTQMNCRDWCYVTVKAGGVHEKNVIEMLRAIY